MAKVELSQEQVDMIAGRIREWTQARYRTSEDGDVELMLNRLIELGMDLSRVKRDPALLVDGVMKVGDNFHFLADDRTARMLELVLGGGPPLIQA